MAKLSKTQVIKNMIEKHCADYSNGKYYATEEQAQQIIEEANTSNEFWTKGDTDMLAVANVVNGKRATNLYVEVWNIKYKK